MNYTFHPDAKAELNEAADYYNGCQRGLGSEFSREVHAAIQNILAYPEAWTPLSKNTRRCLVRRFPYGVIYQITHGSILIVAVMQLNRKPEYWKGRT
ncbi:MAG: type II toxin-antitoxin system RelE/ParE family toxin [Solirubrobacterales bacterium]|jgi:plasmid stabilization system protein ParE